jgi:hypothetical protein
MNWIGTPGEALSALLAWQAWYIGENADNFVVQYTTDNKPCVCIFETQAGALNALRESGMPQGNVLVVDPTQYPSFLAGFAKDGFGTMFRIGGEWQSVMFGEPLPMKLDEPVPMEAHDA